MNASPYDARSIHALLDQLGPGKAYLEADEQGQARVVLHLGPQPTKTIEREVLESHFTALCGAVRDYSTEQYRALLLNEAQRQDSPPAGLLDQVNQDARVRRNLAWERVQGAIDALLAAAGVEVR